MSREERIQVIRNGVDLGMSAAMIAASIEGCTRNSIIGLSNRAGIKLVATTASIARMKADALFKANPERLKEALQPEKKGKTAQPAQAPAPLTTALVIRKPRVADVEPVYEFPGLHYRVHLEDVKSGQCRRPTWNDDKKPGTEVYLFCGKPVKSGSPYCWHCHKKMYDGMPAERRRKNSDRLAGRLNFD